MGEPIWCSVKFRTPVSWGGENDLVKGVIDSLLEFDHRDDEWVIEGEGNYGLWDGNIQFWLDWMLKHKVPFIATSEPKYEHPGETRVFDGHGLWCGESSADSAVLSEETYKAIQAGDSDFSTVEQFFEILNTVTTTKFSIDHLPDKFPSEDLELELSSTIDIIDGKLHGPRDELLLLARTIYDIIEGQDVDTNPTE